MKKCTPEEHKKKLLDLLIDFDKICSKNNFKYYLAYGTLIGAVRHKGFIPWDDDVDILMPREDYNRFVDHILSSEFEHLDIATSQNNSFYCNFSKLYLKNTHCIDDSIGTVFMNQYKVGIFIDVFPLDGIPNNDRIRKSFFKNLSFWKHIRTYKVYKTDTDRLGVLKSLVRNILKLLSKPYNLDKVINKIEERSQIYDYNTSDYISDMSLDFYNYKKEWFGEGQRISFEGKLFNVPDDYDSVLRSIKIYGDYMEIPPPEKRVATHGEYFIDQQR